jgi:hypothetical protein
MRLAPELQGQLGQTVKCRAKSSPLSCRSGWASCRASPACAWLGATACYLLVSEVARCPPTHPQSERAAAARTASQPQAEVSLDAEVPSFASCVAQLLMSFSCNCVLLRCGM